MTTLAETLTDPTYRRGAPSGPGQSAQLPYGSAQALNEASAGVPTAPVMPALSPADQQALQMIPDLSQAPAPPAQPYRPARGTVEEYLFAPTNNPMRSVTNGAASLRRLPPPTTATTLLGLLTTAASEPDAPPQLRILRDLILYHHGEPV